LVGGALVMGKGGREKKLKKFLMGMIWGWSDWAN
jgi:hypothetical protein